MMCTLFWICRDDLHLILDLPRAVAQLDGRYPYGITMRDRGAESSCRENLCCSCLGSVYNYQSVNQPTRQHVEGAVVPVVDALETNTTP